MTTFWAGSLPETMLAALSPSSRELTLTLPLVGMLIYKEEGMVMRGAAPTTRTAMPSAVSVLTVMGALMVRLSIAKSPQSMASMVSSPEPLMVSAPAPITPHTTSSFPTDEWLRMTFFEPLWVAIFAPSGRIMAAVPSMPERSFTFTSNVAPFSVSVLVSMSHFQPSAVSPRTRGWVRSRGVVRTILW